MHAVHIPTHLTWPKQVRSMASIVDDAYAMIERARGDATIS